MGSSRYTVDGAMTTTPTNSRFPFEAHIAKMAPEHQYVIRNLWNSIADAQNAVPVLKSQIDNNTNSIKTVNETINSTSSTENVTNNSSAYTSTIGGVNNQIGNVTYTTAQQDYGYFILFEDASPVAVSLSGNPSIQLPWYCVIINFGVGLVTVTPLAGTISYPNNLASTSMPVAQGQSAIIAYDGNNYYAVVIPVPPQDTPSIAHEWISAYNAITGVFSKAQPAFTDISGTATPAQLPIATTSALGAVEPDGTTITVTSGGVISAVGGSGAGLTTGPTSSTTGDVATFTGTGGQVADSGTLLTALATKASPTFTGTVAAPTVNLSGNLDIENNNVTNPIPLKVNDQKGYGVYLSAENTLNSNYGVNANSSLYLNYHGYADGITQFRDLIISNGKAGNVAIFQGQTGFLGIGTTTPHSNLAVVGLPVYANNAAAITGGLATGDFYQDGGNPSHVCVVQ